MLEDKKNLQGCEALVGALIDISTRADKLFGYLFITCTH